MPTEAIKAAYEKKDWTGLAAAINALFGYVFFLKAEIYWLFRFIFAGYGVLTLLIFGGTILNPINWIIPAYYM